MDTGNSSRKSIACGGPSVSDLLQDAWQKHGGFPASKSLLRWCRRLEDLGSALLPIKLGDSSCLASLAVSGAEWRVLHYVIRQAFTSDMLDVDGVHDPEQLPAPLLRALQDAGVSKWRLHAIRNAEACRASYKALNDVEARRAHREGAVAKTPGQLIRMFRSAVDGEDEAAAQQFLEDLRHCQAVDEHNIAFLALWREARWRPSTVHACTELSVVLRQHERMPFELREVVGRAVLSSFIASWVAEHGAEQLAGLVRHAPPLLPPGLLEQCGALATPVGSAFRVIASLGDHAARADVDDWQAAMRLCEWLDGAVVQANAPQASDPTDAPPNRLGTFSSRLSKLKDADVYQLCAWLEEGDRDAEDLLRQWWELLGGDERKARGGLTRFTQLLWQVELKREPQCSDWLSWMKLGHDDGDFSYDEWPLVATGASSKEWREFASHLDNLAERVFVANLRTLTRAWAAAVASGECASDVVTTAFCNKAFLTILEDENALSAGQRVDELRDLLAVALAAGVSSEAYETVVGRLSEIVGGVSAHRLLEELVDVLELLVDGKHPDVRALEGLVNAFQSAAQRHCTRMERPTLEVVCALLEFRGLSAEADALRAALPPEVVEGVEAGSTECPLRGKKVLIYTLDRPSGERAKQMIVALFGAEVRTDNSKQASAALKGALAWADVVISVTRAAQHAATLEIDRGTDPEFLIRPAGKGSSSILRDLDRWREQRLLGA